MTSASENDLGAAAALFHLHSSPISGTPSIDLQTRFLSLNMPALSLATQNSSLGSLSLAASSTLALTRPRSASWDPTFSSKPLLSLLQVEPDASAAGTLCALMKSSSPTGSPANGGNVTTSSGRISRPRSFSTSAAVAQQQQQRSQNKGLRPRSISVSSNNNNNSTATTLGALAKKAGRPRSYSQSSRVSGKSLASSRSGRKRAMSVDSTSSELKRVYYDEDEDEDSDDLEEEEDYGEPFPDAMDDGLPRVGKYSPDSRRKRIERFLEKRRRRIWRKRIKYDVRKNFADSRLRVKGRFVRKEDEEQLREYLQMT
jgi:hypothetical protein